MKRNKFAFQIASLSILISSFIACDKDFATLDSDIINEENATNFNITSQKFDVTAYTDVLGPVQTNALGLNTLGIYDDVYGRTTSSFVTQLATSTFSPDFGDEVVLDSVVLYIPFFSRITDIDEDGNLTYELDSVIGREPIKLNLYESNYFLRDFNPNGDFGETQNYFSDKSAPPSGMISDAVLEAEELQFVDYDEEGNEINIDNVIEISDEGYVFSNGEAGEDEVITRQPPGIRIGLAKEFWQSKILDQEGESVLSSQNNLNDYFRGLYFKAEAQNDDGSFLILNSGAINSSVTLHYTRLTPATTDSTATEQATYSFRFGPNRVNFFENNFGNLPLNDGDEQDGDARIYLKGGEGSVGKIKLFNGEDVDDDPEMNAFEQFKNEFVVTEDGKFVKSKRLVNEANLVFYVDRDLLDQNMVDPKNEPNRIYLYDAENKTPLIDYFLDGTNNSLPSLSIANHLGPLERDEEDPMKGIRYKLKITEHINNLLLRDSTNVDLGLAVSINVNLEELLDQREVSSEDSDLTTPISSIITPRGTVLHGNNSEDASKRVQLEIFYTCVSDDEDCSND